MTSGFDRLERELRDAEARQVGGRRSVIGSRSDSGALSVAVIAAGTLVVVAIAAGALALLHAAKRDVGSLEVPTAVHRYTSQYGWSVIYPSILTLTAQTQNGAQRFAQITLSSFSARHTLSGTQPPHSPVDIENVPFAVPLDTSGTFPADGVALILLPSPAFILGPDSRFPITLASFGAPHIDDFLSKAAYTKDAVPPSRSRAIVADSNELTATVLIGPKASPALRLELANVIASLSFPHWPAGTSVGLAVLLGPATDYPVGSFTLVHARYRASRVEPVYLVHAPGRLSYGHQCPRGDSCVQSGSFYGIGPQYNTRLEHAPQCELRLDRQHDEFYCTNMGVRWDRVGRVISRPTDESYVGSIEGWYAKITWDGHVMISPGFGPQLSRPAVHELWPSWHQPNEPLSR